MESKYHFHFRTAGHSLLFTELVFGKGGYGDIDYRVLLKDSIISAYLTKKGLKQMERLGNKLLDERYFKKVVSGTNKLLKKLADLERGGFEITEKNLKENYQPLEKIMLTLGKYYLYCEQPTLAPLENILIKKTKDSSHDINELLKNPKLADRAGLSPKEKLALGVLNELGELKLRMHNSVSFLAELFSKIEKIIVDKYNLPENKMAIRVSELKKAIAGKKPDLDLMIERMKGCVLFPVKGIWYCKSGSDYLKWKEKLEGPPASEIKGFVAYPGKATGKVKIHLSWLGKSVIPKGAVLVTGMTNPQIIPLLKNASAIVTDEGGLTCHAAIVSRELKIPCIVGTKIGTQMLKDGDMVEVDANKGIVKIVK